MKSATTATRQARRFGLVGVLNGAIDFSIFSALRAAGLQLVVANVVSVSIAMAFSFFANRRYVFGSTGPGWKRQALLFLAGTAFSMYVLQNLVIVALMRWFTSPLDAAETVGRSFGIVSETGIVLVRSNAAKVIATAVSLTWNFAFYRGVVFRAEEERAARG